MIRRIVVAWTVIRIASLGSTAFGQAGSAVSTSLRLTAGGTSQTLSVADLKALRQTTVKVHNAHNNMDETYSGVSLSDVLAKADFVVNKTSHDKIIHSYVRAEGTDKYWVIYSAIEVEPSEHDGDVIIATSMDGKPLGADGELKLVSTEDKKPQRWVRNLTAITLKSAE
jgi:hypothetical protein